MPSKRTLRRYAKEFDFDDSPLYRVEVRKDGILDHSTAFDPKYEAECEKCDERYTLREGCNCEKTGEDRGPDHPLGDSGATDGRCGGSAGDLLEWGYPHTQAGSQSRKAGPVA